jgi:hypothetical protein
MRPSSSESQIVVFASWAVPRVATFAFNFLQLGLVMLVAHSQQTNSGRVVLLVAFELGILIDCFWRRGSIGAWASVAVVAGFVMLGAQHYLLEQQGLVISATAVCFLAAALKKIRTASDALGSVKRRWRALGYLTAGFFDLRILCALLMLTTALIVVSGIAAHRDKPLCEPFRLDRPRLRSYCVVMFHHLHYFSYAYMLVLLFLNEFMVPEAAIGPLFYVGWLGYYLFINVKQHQRFLVVAGHLLASTAVLLMLGVQSIQSYLGLWFLTGVGGGTIVLFREATIDRNEATYERFKTWESFGHVAGLSLLAWATQANAPRLLFVISACAGVCCAISAAVQSPRPRFGNR